MSFLLLLFKTIKVLNKKTNTAVKKKTIIIITTHNLHNKLSTKTKVLVKHHHKNKNNSNDGKCLIQSKAVKSNIGQKIQKTTIKNFLQHSNNEVFFMQLSKKNLLLYLIDHNVKSKTLRQSFF